MRVSANNVPQRRAEGRVIVKKYCLVALTQSVLLVLTPSYIRREPLERHTVSIYNGRVPSHSWEIAITVIELTRRSQRGGRCAGTS